MSETRDITWQARGRFSQKLVDLSAASAGTVCQKLVDWIICYECRDGCQKLGILRAKHGDGLVKSL